MSFKSTGWEIAGASGLSINVGTPVVNVELGASYIRLPIENPKTQKNVMLQGIGIGGSLGGSISTPVLTASGSLDQFPADGIGAIVKGPAGAGVQFAKADFFGEILVFSISAGKEVSGELSGVLWLTEPVESCLSRMNCSKEELKEVAKGVLLKSFGVAVPAVTSLGDLAMLYNRTKAAGSFLAMNLETQLLGAGLSVFGYRVKA